MNEMANKKVTNIICSFLPLLLLVAFVGFMRFSSSLDSMSYVRSLAVLSLMILSMNEDKQCKRKSSEIRQTEEEEVISSRLFRAEKRREIRKREKEKDFLSIKRRGRRRRSSRRKKEK